MKFSAVGRAYQNLKDAETVLVRKFMKWERTCNDKFGGPPLIPLPNGARARASQLITAPHARIMLDILGMPPLDKQLQKAPWGRMFPGLPPMIPIPVPVFP